METSVTYRHLRDETRDAYRHFTAIQTRWMDNDVYGHVNNVVYYSFFDTAVNKLLIDKGLLEPANGAVIGLVVATSCDYFRPLAFPETIEAGLRIAHLGRSSVRFEIGLFQMGEAAVAAAGQFTHVYVDRRTMAAIAISDGMRLAFRELVVGQIS